MLLNLKVIIFFTILYYYHFHDQAINLTPEIERRN